MVFNTLSQLSARPESGAGQRVHLDVRVCVCVPVWHVFRRVFREGGWNIWQEDEEVFVLVGV